MLDKVNVTRIVTDHIATLKDYATQRYRPTDFVLFFGVPAILTGVLVYFYGTLQPHLTTIVATSLTVFAALLFNLLLIVYDAISKSTPDNSRSAQLKHSFLREVFSNISFAILLAILSIVAVLAFVFLAQVQIAASLLSGVTYFLVSLFLLTLLMLLKRVHVLISHEVRDEK